MKQTDSVQLAFRRRRSAGLLNPGKMIAWADPDFDFAREAIFFFPSGGTGGAAGV